MIKSRQLDIDKNDIWEVDRCPNCGCPGYDVEVAHCEFILFRCGSELNYNGVFRQDDACEYIKELLEKTPSIPPIDCNDVCMHGECTCSGKWRKSGVDY